MSTKIFVNLPVRDLPGSRSFFEKLGFTRNLEFTDENAACAEARDPQDHGWMYGRSFEDLDSHIWEVL
jgi:predicted lactoylglutathione lyase